MSHVHDRIEEILANLGKDEVFIKALKNRLGLAQFVDDIVENDEQIEELLRQCVITFLLEHLDIDEDKDLKERVLQKLRLDELAGKVAKDDEIEALCSSIIRSALVDEIQKMNNSESLYNTAKKTIVTTYDDVRKLLNEDEELKILLMRVRRDAIKDVINDFSPNDDDMKIISSSLGISATLRNYVQEHRAELVKQAGYHIAALANDLVTAMFSDMAFIKSCLDRDDELGKALRSVVTEVITQPGVGKKLAAALKR